jgi:hypothetical protein
MNWITRFGIFFLIFGALLFASPVFAATGDVRIHVLNEAREPVVGARVEMNCDGWGMIADPTDETGTILVNPLSVPGANCVTGNFIGLRVSSTTIPTQVYPITGVGRAFYADIDPFTTSTFHGGVTNDFSFGVETASSYEVKYWNMEDDPTSLPFPTREPDALDVSTIASIHWDDDASPVPGINTARWTANFHKVVTTDAGWYEFDLGADDGGRVFVDGVEVPVVDTEGNGGWRLQSFGTLYTKKKYLTAGSHQIDVQYYQNTGGARLAFTFFPVSGEVPFVHLTHSILSPLNGAVSIPRISVDAADRLEYLVSGSACSGGGTLQRGSNFVPLSLSPIDGDYADCSLLVTDPDTAATASLTIPSFTVVRGETPVRHINTCEELQEVGQNPNTFLDAIQLSAVGEVIECEGIDFHSLDFGEHPFEGIFEGNGMTIAHLNIDQRASSFPVGLFAAASNGTIRNVILSSGSVVGANNTGALVGTANNELITNVTSSVSVTGLGMGSTGGLVGQATFDAGEEIIWSGLSVEADLMGSFSLGGVIGYTAVADSASSFTLNGPLFSGSLSPVYDGIYDGGGIVGYLENSFGGAVTSTFLLTNAQASTTANCGNGFGCGGVIGYLYASGNSGPTQTIIQTSTSTAILAGNGQSIGGFLGYAYMQDQGSDVYLRVASSSANIRIESSSNIVGGFVGGAGMSSIGNDVQVLMQFTHNYVTGSVMGASSVGGFLGGVVGEGPGVYLTGDVRGGLIIDKNFFTGSVVASGDSSSGFIGLAGCVSDAGAISFACRVSENYAQGSVNGSSHVGGLVGSMDSSVSVSNSYTDMNVEGDSFVAGFVSTIDGNSEITNSYASGTVISHSDDAGGLVSVSGGGTISHNFVVAQITGGFGLVNDPQTAVYTSNYFDEGRTGQTSCSSGGAISGCFGVNVAEAPNETYFFNTLTSPPLDAWDFSSIWMKQSANFPVLRRVAGAPELISEDIPMLGSGSADDPYLVTNCTQLQNIQLNVTAAYRLANDIDCSETETWNEGAGFIPIGDFMSVGPFTGFFDGAHHTISHLTIHRADAPFMGLFSVAIGAVFQNVTITDAQVINEAGGYTEVAGTGALIGAMANSVIRGVHVLNSHIQAQVPAGGIIGTIYNIEGSYADTLYAQADISLSDVQNTEVSTTGIFAVSGGMVGASFGGNVENVFASTTVRADGEAGGLIGLGIFGHLRNAFVLGNASSSGTGGDGFLGSPAVGGLLGNGGMYEVRSSVSLVTLFGEVPLGSIVGLSTGMGFYNDYFDQSVTGSSDCAGISSDDLSDCHAINTDGMDPNYFKNTSTVAPYHVESGDEWDFTRAWLQTSEYPVLRTFIAPPFAPANTRVEGDAYTTTTITWDSPSSTSEGVITGYFLQYKRDEQAWSEAATGSVDGLTHSISLPPETLSRSTTYAFRVRAFGDGIEGMSQYGLPGTEAALTTTDLDAAPHSTSTWTGAVSSDWNNAGNWDGGVPSSTTRVVIPYVSGHEVAEFSSTSTIYSLSIGLNMAIVLNGYGFTLTGGEFVNQGTVVLHGNEVISGVVQDHAQGTWEFHGMGSSTPQIVLVPDFGAVDYYNVVFDATNDQDTFQLTDDLHIAGNLTLASGLLRPNSQNTDYTTGLIGEYSPESTFRLYTTSTIDQRIDFSDTNTIANNIVHSEQFSARWEGQVHADYTETYQFCTNADDGTRLWVNGQLVIDDWTIHAAREVCGMIPLVAGSWNDLRLDYFQNGGPGSLVLTSQSETQPVRVLDETNLRHGDVFAYEVRVDGDWVRSEGGFDAYAGTVVFSGGDQMIHGTQTFYDFIKTSDVDATLTFDGYSVMYFLHDVTLQGAPDHLLRLAPPDGGIWFVQSDDATKYFENVSVQFGINVGNHMIVIRDGTSEGFMTEGWQINDTTPPEIGDFEEDVGPMFAILSWDYTDFLDASTTVQYGLTSEYASSVHLSLGSQVAFLEDLTPETLYHYRVLVTDASGNFSTTSDRTFTTLTLDTAAPLLSDIHVVVATTSASISWSTNEDTMANIFYSPSRSYASSTYTFDSDPFRTTHTASLESLLPCVIYHYQLWSADASENVGVSPDATFTTLGCTGGISARVSTSTAILDLTTTNTVVLSDGSDQMTITAPSEFLDPAREPVLQIRSLEGADFVDRIGSPEGRSLVSGVIFETRAILNGGSIVDAFDHPLSVQLRYSPARLSGHEASSLAMYHYHDGHWILLDACTDDPESHMITCQTSSFSAFGLFAAPSSPSLVASGNGGGGGGGFGAGTIGIFGCTDPRAKNYLPGATHLRYIGECIYDIPSGTSTGALLPIPLLGVQEASSTRNLLNCTDVFSLKAPLRFGQKNDPAQVKLLQKYLNTYEGANLPVDGVYSDAVRRSVTQWQQAHAKEVLKPFGLAKGTGNMLEVSVKTMRSLREAVCKTPTRVSSSSFIFTRTLKQGDQGEDVRQLQRFLNQHGYRIALIGNGSPGKETTIFGPALVQSLKKFQTDHADVLMKPLQLSRPTGVFGDATKKLVNTMNK